MPRNEQKPPEEKKPKSEAELFEEAVQKQVRNQLAREEAARRLFARRHPNESKTRKIDRDEPYDRPVAQIMRVAGVQAASPDAVVGKKEQTRRENEAWAERESEARQTTLNLAKAAAVALKDKGVKPQTAVVVKIDSEQNRKFRGSIPTARRAVRQGKVIDEVYNRRELFSKETKDFHSTVAYGWSIPIKGTRSEAGAHLVLCEDGTVLTMRALDSTSIYKTSRVITEAQFNAMDHKLNFEKGTMLEEKFRPSMQYKDDAPGEKRVKRNILVAKDDSYLSPLTSQIESDIASPWLPTNPGEGRSTTIIRREESIQNGIAEVLVGNGLELEDLPQ